MFTPPQIGVMPPPPPDARLQELMAQLNPTPSLQQQGPGAWQRALMGGLQGFGMMQGTGMPMVAGYGAGLAELLERLLKKKGKKQTEDTDA